MIILASILVLLIAALHIWFAVLEMVLWEKPAGLRAFGNSAEKARLTSVMAKNQGLYNLFLVAGLVWSVLHADPGFGFQLKVFFLGCVIVAGLYGAATASRKILFVQAVPAALALIVVLIFANPYL